MLVCPLYTMNHEILTYLRNISTKLPPQDRKKFRTNRLLYLPSKRDLWVLGHYLTGKYYIWLHEQTAPALLLHHHNNYIARLILPELRNYRDHCRKTDKYFPYETTFTYLRLK